MGSHRDWGSRHVSVLDDHDHVFGRKVRFSADAPVEHRSPSPTALQLFGLGIPCIYYGTEQALRSGPEPSERKWLGTVKDNGQHVPAFGRIDVLLREAMFGPSIRAPPASRARRARATPRCPASAPSAPQARTSSTRPTRHSCASRR